MDGLVTMTPSSIEHVGTSAIINANGGVDFENVTSLSLDGVFTGGDDGFDNYVVSYSMTGDAGAALKVVLRSNGLDESRGDYVHQEMTAENGNVNGIRRTGSTESSWRVGRVDSTGVVTGVQLHVYGPYVQQPTAARSVNTIPQGGGVAVRDYAYTHSVVNTSYDGFTISAATNFTGNLIVMGYAE